MGITKTDGFSDDINQMALIFKAIGHPARLSIINYLALKQSCICSDIVDELPLAQPTISRHLSELKAVGLIKGNISGKHVCYCLNVPIWKTINSYLSTLDLPENCRQDDKNNMCC